MTSLTRKIVAVAAVMSLGLACGTPEGPAAVLSVSNNSDGFVFIAQSFDRLMTDSLHYTWQHTKTTAKVTEQSSITAGQVTVVVRDADGKQLYTTDLQTATTAVTAAGSTSDWSIDVKMAKVRGDVVFTIEKPDST